MTKIGLRKFLKIDMEKRLIFYYCQTREFDRLSDFWFGD